MLSPIRLSKSGSPGHSNPPVEASPIPELGPVASNASPLDKIIPSLNGNPPLGSSKCPIPLTSPKLSPLDHVIFETFVNYTKFIHNNLETISSIE